MLGIRFCERVGTNRSVCYNEVEFAPQLRECVSRAAPADHPAVPRSEVKLLITYGIPVQAIGLIAALVIIVVGFQRNVPQAYALAAASLVVAVARGLPAPFILSNALASATSLETLELALSVGLAARVRN